jgi:hypothetical protein
VEGLTITTIGDPNVLTKCLPVLPGLFAPHPDSANFPNATLRERRIRSVRSPNIAIVDLIYRTNFGPSDFVLEEISQTEYLQTLMTADGTKQLGSYFDPTDVPSSNPFLARTAPPSGFKLASPSGVMKFQGKTIIKATGWMLYTDWQKHRRSIRAARWHINSVPWGDDPVNDDRGCWMFANLITRTDDLNFTKVIELYFINDPRGHYPIFGYIDPQTGLPVQAGVTESQVRAWGPPAVGGQWLGNGITRASVYLEIDFNPLFNFSPADA